MRVPTCQPGVVCPPWQLTFEQVSVAGVKAGLAPVFPLKRMFIETEAGATGVPVRGLALA